MSDTRLEQHIDIKYRAKFGNTSYATAVDNRCRVVLMQLKVECV